MNALRSQPLPHVESRKPRVWR